MREDECYKLTLAEMKRDNRRLMRAAAKAKRKVETMRKLRHANFQLGGTLAILREEESQLRDVRWTPPPVHDYCGND